MNFVEREDQKGFNEYLLKVEDFKKNKENGIPEKRNDIQ